MNPQGPGWRERMAGGVGAGLGVAAAVELGRYLFPNSFWGRALVVVIAGGVGVLLGGAVGRRIGRPR